MIRDLTFAPHIAQLQFLSEPHLYVLAGEADPLPSITGILKVEGINSYTDSPNSQWAMQIGTWVHQAVAWLEEGTLEEDTVSDGVLAYLKSYRAWRDATGFIPLVVEEPMWHSLWKYAGTPDLIGRIGKILHVVELKTGGLRPGDRIQVGAQAALVNNCVEGMSREFFRGEVLYLKDTGGLPRVESIDEREMVENTDMFRSILKVYRWKKNNGGKGNGD